MASNQQCEICDEPHETLCDQCGSCVCYCCSTRAEDGSMVCRDCQESNAEEALEKDDDET